MVLIHPYDDDMIIAGQGTIGHRDARGRARRSTASSCRSAAAASYPARPSPPSTIKPAIEMIGVEVKLYPSMYHALRGQPARCGGSTLAEGIAVKNVTERTIAICRQLSTMCAWSARAISSAR